MTFWIVQTEYVGGGGSLFILAAKTDRAAIVKTFKLDSRPIKSIRIRRKP